MKAFVWSVLILLFICSSAYAEATPRSISLKGAKKNVTYSSKYDKHHAIIIAIDDYSDKSIPPLQYAVRDASEINNKLTNIGFKKENIYKFINAEAKRKNILNFIKNSLPKKVGINDAVFVFFAGHGQHEVSSSGNGVKSDKGYLLVYDSNNSDLNSTGISMNFFVSLIGDLPAKHVLFAVDACYSGFALQRSVQSNSYVDKLRTKKSRYVITAGGIDERVYEVAGHGIFTEKFLEGLSGLADLDMDGHVTSSELGTYLKSSVSRASENSQTPIFGSIDGEGEYVFNVAAYDKDYFASMRSKLINNDKFDGFYSAGLNALKGGDVVKAKKHFEEALTIRPNDYWALQKLTYISEFKPYKKAITFSDSSEMLLVTGGAFIMGESTNGFANEKPKRVEHTLDYYMQKYEVTIDQYSRYLASARSGDSPLYWRDQSASTDAQTPVQGVSWDAAKDYCEYYGGRLPSEKEWEYAARGEDGRTYVFGNEFTNNESANWYGDKAHRNTSPVGSFRTDRSVSGIYDLTGNVREWVGDIEDSYLLQEVPVDSKGISFKVVRGGAYNTRSKKMLRPAYRAFRHPDSKVTGIGFRCSKTPDENDIE